jgi:competence protein ComEA
MLERWGTSAPQNGKHAKEADMSKSTVQFVQCRAIGSTLIALVAISAAGLSVAAGGGAASAPSPAAPAKPVKLVDINSASDKELKTLPGIGDAEAAKIVANRPYLTKVDLVTKNVLPEGPYMSLKDRVVAVQKGPPPKPKP